jgi:hypothetical protein
MTAHHGRADSGQVAAEEQARAVSPAASDGHVDALGFGHDPGVDLTPQLEARR